MFVRYWMTRDPVVVSMRDSIEDAQELFRTHHLRRLPVVNHESQLVGLLMASQITASATCVSDAMIRSPLSCDVDDHIEDVGAFMRDHKIGVLPVLSKKRVVGIITDSDIFDAFIHIACQDKQSRRICFVVPREAYMPVSTEVSHWCNSMGLELLAHLSHPVKDESSQLCMLRIRGERSDDFIERLWASNYRVLRVDG